MLDVTGLPGQWRKPLGGVAFIVAAVVLLFWQTWQSMVDIWMRSETYTHGFLVVPISLWLIWSRRDNYRQLQPEPAWLGLLLVFCCGFLWLCAELIHALVVQQWAVVGILVCAIWSLLGSNVTGNMLFPVLFLFLMVPFGEDFVPALMEFTATFVVGMLRLTGISVYREGLHFSLTTGNWSVVDACSGIRYLIASITLGLVYMYLNYSSYLKRTVFMIVATLLPVLANGLRGYMIVMIGHLSNMKLATGVDHIIYGWLFFGLVMLLLFYIGSFWQDPPQVAAVSPEKAEAGVPVAGYPHFPVLLAMLTVCLLIWLPAMQWLSGRQAEHVEISLRFTRPPDGQWQSADEQRWGWQPDFKGVINSSRRFFSDGTRAIGLYAGNFGAETAGELVNSQNMLIARTDSPWQVQQTGRTAVELEPGRWLDVDETVLRDGQRELLVYRWYQIGSYATASSYTAKLLQLFKRLTGDTAPELMIVLYTGTSQMERPEAASLLQRFVVACCK